jgi:PAS domain S-box-containing protein
MNSKRTRQVKPASPANDGDAAGARVRRTARRTARQVIEMETIFESMLDGIIIYDADGRIVRMNHIAADILGYSQERRDRPVAERLALLRFETEPGEPLPPEMNPVLRALRGESVQEVSYTIHPSASRTVRLRITAAPLRNEAGDVIGAVATAEDVTYWYDLRMERERLLAESQLRASQLDAVVSFVPHGLVVQGPQGDVRRMNAAAARILGYSINDLRGRSFEEQMANVRAEKADGTPFDLRYFPSVRALAGDTVRGVPVIIHPPDGRTVWLLFSSSPVFDPEGVSVGAVNTFADITSLHDLRVQREAQMQELAQTASHLEAALASMTNGVIILNSEGDIVRMNEAASRILGYTVEQWRQFTPAERLKVARIEAPDGRPLSVEELPAQRALRGEVVRDSRLKIRRPSGHSVWIWTAASPIIAADGRTLGVVASLTDVTGLRDLPPSA